MNRSQRHDALRRKRPAPHADVERYRLAMANWRKAKHGAAKTVAELARDGQGGNV